MARGTDLAIKDIDLVKVTGNQHCVHLGVFQIPAKNAPTVDRILASGYHDDDEIDPENLVKIYKHLRSQITKWADDKIKLMMVDFANRHKIMPTGVGSFHHLLKVWRECSKEESDDMALKMYEIMYGEFDCRVDWKSELSQQFRTIHQWKFTDPEKLVNNTGRGHDK